MIERIKKFFEKLFKKKVKHSPVEPAPQVKVHITPYNTHIEKSMAEIVFPKYLYDEDPKEAFEIIKSQLSKQFLPLIEKHMIVKPMFFSFDDSIRFQAELRLIVPDDADKEAIYWRERMNG